MKVKYPAEAFALAIAVFSIGMKASFIAGILVILAVVFAEFLKNLLEPLVPDWSVKSCVFIGTAALSAAAFTYGFETIGIAVEWQTWLIAFAIGMFAAKHVLMNDLEAEYGEIFWESGIVWGFWLVFAIIREFLGNGKVFGFYLGEATMQSKSFREMFFGFFVAGIVLAIANAILKKKLTEINSLFVVVPIITLARPFNAEKFGEIGGIIWTIILPLIMLISVRKTLKFSRTMKVFRGLPIEMLSMGFIYMILSIY